MKIFIIIIICLLIGFLAGNLKSSTSYDTGYVDGFDKGLDTAAAIDDKSFDSLMTIMKADQLQVEKMLIDLGAMQTESFPNHSEIR